MAKWEVILVAGGQGRRMQQPQPKAFLALAGLPLYMYSLRTFAGLPEVSGVILVVPAGQAERAWKEVRQLPDNGKVREIADAGPRRQDSVRNGMDALSGDAELVLVHDAARPFASAALIRRVAEAAARTGASVPGLPVVDTLKRVSAEGRIEGTVDRRNLVAVQTPQGFQSAVLRQAYQHAWKDNLAATDDAGLVELAGQPVSVVEGEAINFKITRSHDLELAEWWIGVKKVNCKP
ncbi:MAG: 2-C-methyl-D-erythritol 4-phosphate cytidylyltransferase [candidate division FCPU426 bacterium]